MNKSRRKFIRDMMFATAGISIGSGLFTAKSYSRIKGANDRVVVGLVGFSDRAKDALIPALMLHSQKMNFEIKGISDIWNRRREEGIEYMKKKYDKNVMVYMNNDELYNDKDIDAVIISTADFQHALHTVEAAKNKRDAYVEKPFAETMEDNNLAKKAVEESGIILQIGSQRRSGINYHAANDFIRSGKFGGIKMVEMTWNVNQPGRWRRPKLVSTIKESDTDWKRYILNRPFEAWDPRKYIEYRLFWPYSSGIPGQWMSHQIDTVHWFSGYKFPRSVVANGGIYMWNDGRKNNDAMTAVFDYGPEDDLNKGFQVLYSSRMFNSAGGVKEIYYSNSGELNLDSNKVTANGGLTKEFAEAMGMKENLLEERILTSSDSKVATSASTGVDEMVSLHMLNWMECIRSRKQPNAPVEAGYNHSIANIMVTAALRTKKYVTFDKERQEVLADGKIFQY